jgi:hypothetical protein
MASFLRKASPAAESLNGDGHASGGAWSQSLPALVEFLSATAWPDGTARQTGTMTLFADGPAWKLCLADRDQGLVAFITAPEPFQAMQSAEQGLVGDTLDWRRSGPRKGKRS